MTLLLASRSSTRRQMLEAANVPFETIESGADEEAAKEELASFPAEALAMRLAELKALGAPAGAGALVLGADQTLELADGRVLGKPSSQADSRAQLQAMSGLSHRLHSAAAVAERGEIVWRGCERATLTMRPLSDGFIERYVAAEFEHIRWNVGGYRIEGPGVQLFERIGGSHFAILGLPLLPLLHFLRERGIVPS